MAKVLLADDEVTMVQMVTEVLRAEGHEVFPFTNGSAALEAIETVAPELVITDLYLDKTRAQGIDILHKARSALAASADRSAHSCSLTCGSAGSTSSSHSRCA